MRKTKLTHDWAAIATRMHRYWRQGAVATAIAFVAGSSMAEDLKYELGSGYIFDGYGQFHFAYQSFDDGRKTTDNLVDITNAPSLIGFHIEPADGSDGLSFQFESSLGFRQSSVTSQTTKPSFHHWTRRDFRYVQLIYSGAFGTFKLGQGSMPADGAAQSDLGGTVVVAKSAIQEANGAYFFRAGTGALSDVTIKDTFESFDGSRRFRLRYDTPGYQGFSLAVAYGIEILTKGINDDYYEGALRYTGSFGNLEVQAAASLAFADTSDGVNQKNVGSVSILDKASGLNLQVAVGQSDAGAKPHYIYLKGGWNKKFMDIGVTKLAFELFSGNDYVVNGSNSEMLGIAVIQEFERANIEAYAGYRAFSFGNDGTPVSYKDANAVQIGMRFRF